MIATTESPRLLTRLLATPSFDDTDELISHISRTSIDTLSTSHRNGLLGPTADHPFALAAHRGKFPGAG